MALCLCFLHLELHLCHPIRPILILRPPARIPGNSKFDFFLPPKLKNKQGSYSGFSERKLCMTHTGDKTLCIVGCLSYGINFSSPTWTEKYVNINQVLLEGPRVGLKLQSGQGQFHQLCLVIEIWSCYRLITARLEASLENPTHISQDDKCQVTSNNTWPPVI